METVEALNWLKGKKLYELSEKLSTNVKKVFLPCLRIKDEQILVVGDTGFENNLTRGIDVNTKNEIYNLISELAVKGIGIIVVSSELPEIMAISDRIIVLSEGRQKVELSREEINEETIIHAALPESI